MPVRTDDSTVPGSEENPDAVPLCSDDEVRSWLPPGLASTIVHPCRKIVFTIVSRDQGWADNTRAKGSYKGSYSWFDVGLERYGPVSSGAEGVPGPNEAGEDAPPPVTLRTICPGVVEIPPEPSPPAAPPVPPVPLSGPSRRYPARTASSAAYKFDIPLLPGPDVLQFNRLATRQFTEHVVTWSWTDDTPAPTPAPAEGGDPAATDGDSPHPLEEDGRGVATGDGAFVRSLRVGDVVTVWAKTRFSGWCNVVSRVRVDVYWAV